MKIPLRNLNVGEVSPQVIDRADVEKIHSACRRLENALPNVYGGVSRRPGTKYISEQYVNTGTTVRLIPFIYSSSVAYIVELGDQYARFFYNDAVVGDAIETPYLAENLFELHCKQAGDVMWIVHSSYAPRKLSRTSATEFALEEIEFNGPFMVRNDLINPAVTDTAYMVMLELPT
jgi:hypothetical protein